jgi:hypothetical protein
MSRCLGARAPDRVVAQAMRSRARSLPRLPGARWRSRSLQREPFRSEKCGSVRGGRSPGGGVEELVPPRLRVAHRRRCRRGGVKGRSPWERSDLPNQTRNSRPFRGFFGRINSYRDRLRELLLVVVSTSSGSSAGSGRVATAAVTSSASGDGVAYTPVPQNGHIFQRSTSGRSQRAQVRFRRVWHHGQKMNSGSTRCLHTGHELWTWMPCRKASSSSESS